MSKAALIITCYNRPELLQQCLDSLLRADLSQLSQIIIHDDASIEHLPVSEFIQRCNIPVIFMRQPKNVGIKQSLLTCYEVAFVKSDIVINLDGDAIVKNEFVSKLLWLKGEYPDYIISGFNCNHPKNPVIAEAEVCVERKHCNGINMCINLGEYDKIIKPALLGSGNWDYSATHDKPFVIARPSLVQHNAPNDSTMGHTNGDVACDFKLLTLPQVSLFGIDAHDPAGITRAADICTRDIEFAGSLIITQHDYFRGREGYSKFMIKDLHEHVKELPGTHILTIHEDGYVQRAGAWSDEFLQYDYIGATWWYKDGMNVGNGGFSLRSKRLIELCSKLDIDKYHPEDNVLCRELRPMLEEQGIKFAPDELANMFSIEAYGIPRESQVYSGQFGFHGRHVSGLPVPPKPRNAPVSIPLRKPSVQNGRLKPNRFR